MLHIGLSIPGTAPDRTPTTTVDFARRAEQAGGLGPLVGTPEDLVRGAHEYFDAGVEVLVLGSVSAAPRHLDMLCERVLPKIGRG